MNWKHGGRAEGQNNSVGGFVGCCGGGSGGGGRGCGAVWLVELLRAWCWWRRRADGGGGRSC